MRIFVKVTESHNHCIKNNIYEVMPDSEDNPGKVWHRVGDVGTLDKDKSTPIDGSKRYIQIQSYPLYSRWYADKLGEVFQVESEGAHYYEVMHNGEKKDVISRHAQVVFDSNNYLQDTKFENMLFTIKNEEDSRHTQLLLFSMGYKWMSGSSGTVMHLNSPYLLTATNGDIMFFDKLVPIMLEYVKYHVKVETVVSRTLVKDSVVTIGGKEYTEDWLCQLIENHRANRSSNPQ